MAEGTGDWSAKSNDALIISLVTPEEGSSKTIASFHPKFTYPIFGDEETIFGYQGLNILLRYNASDMRPSVQVLYERKFKPIGETEAADIPATLAPFLPKGAFDKTSVFNVNINDEIYKDWTPPGELIKTLPVGDSTYEVWKGNLFDKPIQQLVKRLQILIPLFIEGGTLIEMDDPEWSLRRWTIFFLYKKDTQATSPKTGSPYVFMGYSTVYRFYPLQKLPTPPRTPSKENSNRQIEKADFALPVQQLEKVDFTLPFPNDPKLACRTRISQFVILPPFQGGGNGSRFYETIFTHYLLDSQTVEITVEDPNEEFDDLRDLNDLKRLRRLSEFDSIHINTATLPDPKGKLQADVIVNKEARNKLRKSVKIAPRQFIRLVEMQLLSRMHKSVRKAFEDDEGSEEGTPTEQAARKHEYHLWVLFVKQRLYRHNKDQLIQLDIKERIDKLDDTLDSVEGDYERLLMTLERRQVAKPDGEKSNGKRAATEDEDDSDDAEPASKKARVEDA